ncbi:hypothetical protein TI03_01470, partial [Achromatium sp. WMS1]
LNIAGLPVFYTPYLSIPIDDRRKSGFLFPTIGISSRLGTDLRVPYYWNIDPQLDATITPRIMTQRGLIFGGEVRYLTNNNRGTLHGEVLLQDKQSTEDGNLRGQISFNHTGNLGFNWKSNIKLDTVSDSAYIEDFGGGSLQVTSVRQMERLGEIHRFGQNWHLLGRLQSFQTIDRTIAPEDQPYNRLPQILFDIDMPFDAMLQLKFQAENVYFQQNNKVQGNRLAFRPTLTIPLRRTYGHFQPSVTINQVNYWLTNQSIDQPTQLYNTIPSFSLDTGLILERDINWFNTSMIQTLEPRLYYLYTPYYNQNKIPVFDSAEFDFSFLSLFRDNRFSGRDRIADANQITFALTTNFISSITGRELLRTSVGQTFYFTDRRVQLATNSTEQEGSSSIIGEITTHFDHNWSSRANILWDPHRDNDSQLRKAVLGVQYHTSTGHLLNLNYRLNESDIQDGTTFEDTELSFRWPVSSRWQFVSRWLYSLRYNQTTEAFTGFEYSSCCWRIRGLVRNFISDIEQKHNFSVMLQLELTGLGKFGNSIENFLQDSIYGY